MGYLTTITIRNDCCDSIKKHPEQFINSIYDACLGVPTRESNDAELPLGNSCNAIIVQKPRHADDHTIYIHMGNTLQEINVFSNDIKDLIDRHPDFAKSLFNELEIQYKGMKKLLNET